jgi:hypothetical protein
MELPRVDGPSILALENMLTHTQSLQSLNLNYPSFRSGLENNTTLRELTLTLSQGPANISPILTSLRHHPLLQRLCLCGDVVDLTGIETVLLSETSRITELEIDVLEIDMSCNSPPTMGLTRVLRALALHPALIKLVLRRCPLGHDEVGLLRMVLDNISSLHTLVLTSRTLGSAALAELAPALYQNTSIKELDLSGNGLNNMESASILRDVIRSNKIMTTLDFF